jgi:hypothetical protein
MHKSLRVWALSPTLNTINSEPQKNCLDTGVFYVALLAMVSVSDRGSAPQKAPANGFFLSEIVSIHHCHVLDVSLKKLPRACVVSLPVSSSLVFMAARWI